jgi:phosphate transport system substrate-binding protein
MAPGRGGAGKARGLARGLALGLLATGLLAFPARANDLRPAQRDQLLIATSHTAAAMAGLLSRAFVEARPGVPAPTLDTIGSTRALEAFCAGNGIGTPDIAVVSRRMPRAVFDLCRGNGVTEIVEQKLGLGAVVLAVRRGTPPLRLTSTQVFAALAAEQPNGEEFLPNRAARWSDVEGDLPPLPVRVLVPEPGSGTRTLFDELVMEGGCRGVRQIRMIFSASYRYGKCVTLRRDEAATALPSAAIPSALLAAPSGTIAVLSYGQLLASGGNFLALALDGTLPTPASIANQDYEQTQTFYVYGKRQHEAAAGGPVVVRGIRAFMAEAASEAANGPGGYLTLAGLVPLPPLARQEQRQLVARQALMSR